MIIANEIFNNMLSAPVRELRGRVELYNGSTLELICGCHDRLQSFTVERIGESNKFFGYGVCQKLNTHLLDTKRELNVTTAHTLEVEFGVGSSYIYPYPNFYVTEVNRDEKTNALSITAYDALYKAAQHTVDELDIAAPYTIRQFAEACATILGLPVNEASTAAAAFNTVYATGANFEGTETVREALDAVAEATQTIYFINNNWELTFIRLDINGAPVATIDREKYIELNSKTNRRLTTIVHATELGDNLSATTGVSGSTQYIRNNPFWELADNVAELVDTALANAGGLTINQFEMNWRGNYLLEIGDKIELETKDNNKVIAYILDDTVTFNGSLSGATRWAYKENEAESASTPTNLGEAIKQTYAKVDKANKQIEMVASEISANSDAITALQINTESINASVEKIEKNSAENLEIINSSLATLTERVEAQITAEAVTLEIQKELANGSTKVETTTGFTFNEEGLSISKSGSEISTTITEDGMAVSKNNKEVLKADNEGVKAEDLHATTYLVIGNNSRFEDYGSRTGCFWIGGNS